jgi:hypothetical protein
MLCREMFLLVVCGSLVALGWEDQFDGKTLDARWQWRVPVAGPTMSLTARKGWLRIRLPDRKQGFNHWNEPKPVDEAPQLRTAAPKGDWQLEARLHLETFAPADSFLLGLVAGPSDDSILTIGSFQYTDMEKAPQVWFEPTGTSGLFRSPVNGRDVYLRLVRKGNLCRGQVSLDGKAWTESGCCIMTKAPQFVGVIGKTFSAGPEVVFDVDYVRLTPLPSAPPDGPRLLVGVGGDYPTGYRGLLARLGLPYQVLIDYQLTDVDVLRRFDLLLVGSVNPGLQNRAHRAIMEYIRGGGTALIDSRACPPPPVVPGTGKAARNLPDILLDVPDNPLKPWLGEKTRFPAGESRYHFSPSSTEGLQILAHFDAKPAMFGKKRGTVLPPGTPAIWAMPLGKGLMVYSSPSIGATLSWGPKQDALAEALLHCLGGGHLQPQLVEEGLRFGRKESVLTEGCAAEAPTVPQPPPFKRRELAVARSPLPAGFGRIRGNPAPEFNLSGRYNPRQGKAQLLLNHWNQRYTVSLVLDGHSARLARIENGKTVATAVADLGPAQDVPFVIKERRNRLALLVPGHRAEIEAEGLWDGSLAASGGSLANVRYQPVAPAFQSDDFMRGEKDQGAWQVLAGKWSVRATGNPKMGANPFTYRCERGQGRALSATGLPFWDDYDFQVSAKPADHTGSVGLAFHLRDKSDYLFVRWRVGNAPNQADNGVEIVRVSDGHEVVLAHAKGNLVPGQWYRLGVRTQDGVATAVLDGRDLVSAKDASLGSGKVALLVQDGEAEFDDMAVRPPLAATGPKLVELDGTIPRFAGTMDRDTWAGTALQWRADAVHPGLFWRHGDFLGDVDLSFACDFSKELAPSAAMALLLAPATGDADSGYSLVLHPATSPVATKQERYDVVLNWHGQPVTKRSVVSGARPALALRRIGSDVVGFVDDHEVVRHSASGPARQLTRLGFLATDLRPRISGLRLRAGNTLDYYFDHAPTDWWIGSGTWELAVRWPCTPEWSWLAGESRGVAALWHKRRFMGNQTLDLHVGPRTVAHSENKHPREICRAFNVVLCGDGKNVNSGYSFVVGTERNGSGVTLSRNGKVVAREPAYRIYSDAHNQWINVRAQKDGNEIRLWVGDQRILDWHDPNPLPGGRLAVWTKDNGIMIPRVTVYYENSGMGG